MSPELAAVLLTVGLLVLPVVYTLISMGLAAWSRSHYWGAR